METWKPIAGFDGYEVSDEGRVRSLDRRVKTWYGDRLSAGKVLKPQVHAKTGYAEVVLTGQKWRLVHRLVAEAFHGPCPAGMECLHGNDIRTDCRAENLRWGSHKENADDARTRKRYATGERHGKAVLTDEQRRQAASSDEPVTVLATRLGVSAKTIYRARGAAY